MCNGKTPRSRRVLGFCSSADLYKNGLVDPQDSLRPTLRALAAARESFQPIRPIGVVTDFAGLLVESEGPLASIGDICEVQTGGVSIRTQVVGFRSGRVLSMPLQETVGLQPGSPIAAHRFASQAPVGINLLGRVVDAFGAPIDGKGILHTADSRELLSDPLGPMEREAIDEPLVTGVRVIDALLPCGKGQRVGIFGGAGVGKSTLLGAMARNSSCDVNVVALVGERNREVRAFLEETLGPEGLAKSVIVAATSDRPAPVRVRAAFLAATVADWFREQGKDVLLILDSITRLAMAQREIGLAVGEPPSQKGYTPSVFQLLPRLFERAGKYASGSVTGFYTVLMEGDDINDPIADAARSLLDGHIVLSRDLAEAGQFPAIDALESLSRLSNAVASEDHLERAGRLRESMAAYRRSEDLINLGAYAAGSNPQVDAAVRSRDEVVGFLKQDLADTQPLEDTLDQLRALSEKL